MGTIITFRNVRFCIYSNDHRPAHVHAISPKGEAKIEIETLEVFFVRGFTQKDIKRMVEFLESHKDLLKEHWNEIHEKR